MQICVLASVDINAGALFVVLLFSVAPALRDGLVWQECSPRRGGDRRNHTLATLRSLDKWIIGLMRLCDARPVAPRGFTLLPGALSNWGGATVDVGHPGRRLSVP